MIPLPRGCEHFKRNQILCLITFLNTSWFFCLRQYRHHQNYRITKKYSFMMLISQLNNWQVFSYFKTALSHCSTILKLNVLVAFGFATFFDFHNFRRSSHTKPSLAAWFWKLLKKSSWSFTQSQVFIRGCQNLCVWMQPSFSNDSTTDNCSKKSKIFNTAK